MIYTSLCLTALYMALQKKSARSMILFGMALSFKLQTVFFLPALLPLWLRKDIKLRHLALIPAAYMAMMIPAFWGGKSLHHALTVYTAQASTYNFMTVNGPSLYNFLPASMDRGTLYTMFSGMAMALGMAMLVIVCLMVCLHREHITREGTLLTCLLVLGGVSLWKADLFARFAQAVPEGVPVLVCCAVCAVSAANFLTTPSVSLEGRTVWLLQSLPIPSWQALCAKLELHLLLTGVPAALCLVCMQAAVQMQVLYSSLQVAADGAPAALLLTEECTRATVAVQLLPPFVWEDPLPPLPDVPAALTLQLTMQDVMAIDTAPAALAQKLVHSTSGKCWLHHPKAETFLSERLALLQRVYK